MTHQRTRRCISLWNITSYELGLLQWIRFIFRKCLMRQVLNKSPWTCHGNVFIRTSLAPVFSLSLTVTISRCKRWMFSHNILYVLARKIINFFFMILTPFFGLNCFIAFILTKFTHFHSFSSPHLLSILHERVLFLTNSSQQCGLAQFFKGSLKYSPFYRHC